MVKTLGRLAAAAVLLGGAALVSSAPPAQADYVPFTIVNPTEGPPGTVITATGDTWCATTTQVPGENIQPGVPGSVIVEFGVMEFPIQLGNESNLAKVLATTTATVGADGMWTAQITVPAGTAPGEQYGVMGHCTVEYDATTSTTSVPETTAPSSTTGLPPDSAAHGDTDRQARATLEIDFFPAQFEVLPAEGPVPTTAPTSAAPADAVPGQASYTG
jgi:hypothetical protein